MQRVLARSAEFSIAAFLLVFTVDVLLSGVYQALPPREYLRSVVVSHALFHSAVLILSAIGCTLGYFIVKSLLPSRRLSILLGSMFGFMTVVAGPGSLVLAGPVGVVAWLLLGSTACAIGAGLHAAESKDEKSKRQRVISSKPAG